MRPALTPAFLPYTGRYLAAILAFGAVLAGCGSGGSGPVDVPDTQPPTVSILAPPAGPVTGVIPVTAAAFDNRGVVGVQFLLDDATLGSEVTAPPWTISWDTRTATNGPHVLRASARDAAGYATISDTVKVSVTGGI